MFTFVSLTLGGLLIVFESMIPPAWKDERDPMENQDEFDWTDFWLLVERTDRFDSKLDELIEDKAEKRSEIIILEIFFSKYN